MATTAAKATAAPTTVVLGGKEYYASPLTDADYGEFEKWVQDKAMDVAKRNLDGLTPEQQEKLLQHAYERSLTINLMSREALTQMNSMEGISKMLWMSLRHKHPDIEQSEVAAHIVEASDNMDAALDALERIAPGQEKKVQPRRKIKRKKRLKPTRR